MSELSRTKWDEITQEFEQEVGNSIFAGPAHAKDKLPHEEDPGKLIGLAGLALILIGFNLLFLLFFI